jgi:methionyl-tRNA synthetase
MLWAAGLEAPKRVFAHGFVNFDGDKISKSRIAELKKKGLDYLLEPMEIIRRFSAEGFRYYFLRDCPYPSDGEVSPDRFIDVFNSELANKLGNLRSRTTTIPINSYDKVLAGTAGVVPEPVVPNLNLAEFVATVRGHVEGCRYNLALQAIMVDFLTPTDQYLEANAPWKLVKTDKEAAKRVLFNAVQSLRVASILLKPFIPRAAETIYTSFNFPKPWGEVKYADAAELAAQPDDLRVTAELVDGKVKPLFPRIG